ncbi:MAG: hypothetical protein GX606_01440 [Elusimicrobia bacterium]|nr:hypothetical protein [Elusimicrobiota bacterium]
MNKVHAFIGFCCVILLAVVLSGCDVLVPKKPVRAKPQAEAPAAPAAQAVADKDTPLPDGVIAKVGDWTLTMDEFNQRIDAVKKVVPDFDDKNLETKQMIVDELIRQQLLVQEARAKGLDKSKDVRDAVRDFENNIIVQGLVSDLTKDIAATEKDARDYYDANTELFVRPVEKQLREIVVPTEAEAKDILVQVLQGASFADTAKARSKGKTAANGGDLGFLAEAPFEQMQKAIEGLSKGSPSAVFQGPEGYYLVKVDDVRGGDKVSFEEVKEDLIQGLTAQKQQEAVLGALDAAAQKIQVKVNAALLEK